ncbi:hypothetical protein LN42_02415 [Marinitoga sp. 1137]|uniref:AAA family ATPase n=1 Tax=Marinitoga sp. 1137 TaxID=1545835 RepID=UPI0009508D0A|nr:AAA family ATPase [Marinitoga sp. 1137]APT75365.1 hypothetical protein LN42_02415 [Marinitoga sp. 1137]
MKELKSLPLGESNFKTIMENNMYFIDKSMLIKDILSAGRVILITRPRRFGKTLNMSMLEHFFSMKENSENLFKDLKIWNEKKIIEKYLNNYPVIFISFKGLKKKKYEDMKNGIRELISKLYTKYVYLLNTDKITQWDKKRIIGILDKTAEDAVFEDGIKNLTEYLYIYHGKKVILLIDEYDTPIQQSYLNGYYDELIDFIGNILGNALKDNEYLEKAVLTGITRVAKESIFTGVNNLQISTVLSRLFNDKFGMTKEELHEALKYYGMEYEEEKIIEWYNGFNFGGFEIYNPYSIMNLIFEKEIKNYWINTSGNKLIKDLIAKGSAEIKSKIYDLIEGETVTTTINENLVYGDLNVNVEESVWTLFLFTGYLTWIDKIGEGNSAEYRLKITNKEALDFFKKTVVNILEDSGFKYKTLLKDLIEENYEEFKENFKELVENTISYFDVSGKEPERFYHGLILGLSVGLQKEYIIKSNRESGYGRADLILIPKKRSNPGIIFEFKKYYKKDGDLKSSAEKGMKQIEEKNYETEIKSHGIERIIKVAIAFDKKDVEIVIK